MNSNWLCSKYNCINIVFGFFFDYNKKICYSKKQIQKNLFSVLVIVLITSVMSFFIYDYIGNYETDNYYLIINDEKIDIK